MAETEEYFPRGGKKPSVLFKNTVNFLGRPGNSEKKTRKPKKRSDGDDGYLSDEETREIDNSIKNCAIGLSYKTVKEGVLILGRVSHIQDTKLTVMLPCRLIGQVMACHISEPYNKLLEAYVNDEVDKVQELSQMFHRGQYIAVKVLEVQQRNLILSALPQHVNGAKQNTDVNKGSIFQAAVLSVEDHGYVMDIGIPNTRTFLPKKETEPDIELDVGMITWCAVKSVSSENSIVKLSATTSSLQDCVLKRKPVTTLLPGTAVDFTVDTPLENGIEGQIFGDTTCYVQRQHVDKVKGKKPSLGQKVRARVLYVMPIRNCPFLTMKNIFESPVPDLTQEQKLQDGDIVEEAQVLKIIGRSVHFKLGRGSLGILSLRRIQIHEDFTDEQIVADSYPVGSTHRVRVLCYNLSDYVYSVSDEAHILNEKYFSLQQLSPGDLVTATVKSVSEKMVELTVGRVRGFVPHTHITEAGVFVDPKKAHSSKLPHMKYKVGQEVTARVLSVDYSKNSLALTMKPSLLAPELTVLKSYEEAVVGQAYVGVIKFISDYLLVSFFNNVTAFVPRWMVSQDTKENIADAFHRGQIVTCTIISVNPEEKKMSASLIKEPFIHDENRPKKKWRQANDDSSDVIQPQSNDKEIVPNKKHKLKDSETEDDKKKKKKKREEMSNNAEILEESIPKKKRKKNVSETDKDGKKKKKQKESNAEILEESVAKNKRKKKESETENEEKSNNESIEESDAIETDIYDEDDLLTPQEKGLLDMSDCTTLKHLKKRVAALLKSVNSKTRRMNVIESKIDAIEEKGLTAQSKKYHTAMHTEKLVVEERMKKLMEGLDIARSIRKEIGYEGFIDMKYKEEQKMRKKERMKAARENKKKDIIEKTGNKDKETKNNNNAADLKDKLKYLPVVESMEPVLQVPSAKEFWSANADNLSKTVPEKESSSSEDEAKEKPKKKRKKLSVAEKLAKVREEEERVREMERAALASESQPRSVDQFERSALAHPASSQLWIAYMAFHLQATEIDKARAVARKALNTIPFREEHEKLNVWLALINLEQRFGTQESQQKTLEDALQMNDPYKVHTKLLDIYVETGKHQELASLAELMMRKYKRVPEAYIQAGAACYRLGLVDKARHVMQKAISVLEKKEHVSVLVQFALLERSHGSRERAEALLEQVLATYPQRVDVCAVYVDMLLKGGDIDNVRQLMDRMTSLKLPARKMKVLYKKWVEVEEKHGDQTKLEAVRQRALEYIEKAKY